MPWTPPDDYEPKPNLPALLKSLSPKMNTSEMDMVIYWQWVHECLPGTCRTPQEAWAGLGMTVPHAQDAIDKSIVPLEIYPRVLKRATERLIKTVGAGGVDDAYEPLSNLEGYLRSISPKMNTAEFDMVVYWQWVHATPLRWQKSPAKAWKDLRMTQKHAREAIEKKIVPMEIYPEAYERAYPIGLAKEKAKAKSKPASGTSAKSKPRR